MGKFIKWLKNILEFDYKHEEEFDRLLKKYPIGSTVRYFGVVMATVTDVEDEEGDGIIHVEITYFDKNLVKRVERVYPREEWTLEILND